VSARRARLSDAFGTYLESALGTKTIDGFRRIDQALAGIDKLLKSQELTFAFVGVAPAFAIVYIIGGYLKALWTGGRSRGKYGGKKKRAGVWVTMRQVSSTLV